jgi:hypothetical protein
MMLMKLFDYSYLTSGCSMLVSSFFELLTLNLLFFAELEPVNTEYGM